MECFFEQKQFLYKYKSHLDFVLLTANKSVSDSLIEETPDLPWNLDVDGKRHPIPKEYIESLTETHTVQDQNEWNYIEACCNPYWNWDKIGPKLDNLIADPKWERFQRWFFQNWSMNPAIFIVRKEKIDTSRADRQDR